jgi:hypothetical protein
MTPSCEIPARWQHLPSIGSHVDQTNERYRNDKYTRNNCLLHKPTAQNAPLIHNCFWAAVLEGFLYSPTPRALFMGEAVGAVVWGPADAMALSAWACAPWRRASAEALGFSEGFLRRRLGAW